MTLDEAIKHAEEVMIENLEKTMNRNSSDPIAIQCYECADEHRQLAEWLKDYKRLLEQTQIKDGDRAVSLNAAKEELSEAWINKPFHGLALIEILECLNKLPPVTPCEDAISRQAVLDQTYLWSKDEFLRVTNPFDYLRKRINSLPFVNPQEPKTGHWIEVIDEIDSFGNKTWHHKCSICGNENSGWGEYKYCPNCGCRMVEPQEISDRNLKMWEDIYAEEKRRERNK